MNLLDHFHPPLSLRRHWQSFHNAWATYIASALNELLPPGFFAEPNVQFGVEIDVATFEESSGRQGNGGAEAYSAWQAPAPVQTLPFACESDVVEITVFDQREGPVLAGAIELVSPANKDRQEHRDAFTAKCEAVLRQGAGLVIVDIVTSRTADSHALLMERVARSAPDAPSSLFASAYRPVRQNGATSLDVWLELLSIGGKLPTMPLHLRATADGPFILPLDLAATYARTCREQRVPVPN
jgi:hypothetical protein